MKLENMGKVLDEIREGGRFRKVQDLRMVTASKGVRRDGSAMPRARERRT